MTFLVPFLLCCISCFLIFYLLLRERARKKKEEEEKRMEREKEKVTLYSLKDFSFLWYQLYIYRVIFFLLWTNCVIFGVGSQSWSWGWDIFVRNYICGGCAFYKKREKNSTLVLNWVWLYSDSLYMSNIVYFEACLILPVVFYLLYNSIKLLFLI